MHEIEYSLTLLGLADDRRGEFSIVLVGNQIADSVFGSADGDEAVGYAQNSPFGSPRRLAQALAAGFWRLSSGMGGLRLLFRRNGVSRCGSVVAMTRCRSKQASRFSWWWLALLLEQLGDEGGGPGGAARLDRAVVDLAPDLLRDRVGDRFGGRGLEVHPAPRAVAVEPVGTWRYCSKWWRSGK